MAYATLMAPAPSASAPTLPPLFPPVLVALPAVLALDLDVIKTIRQRKTFDLGALGAGGAVGHQRQLDAARLQFVDRIMRAGEDEHFLFAVGGEAVGQPHRKIL